MLRKHWPLLLVIAIAAAVLGQVVTFYFVVWDDPVNVTENPSLSPPTLANLWRFWKSGYYGLYVPLTYSLWFGLGAISGLLNPARPPYLPWIYHAANLLLHLASTSLVYVLVWRLMRSRWAAAAAACCFAIHPMQVETAAWVTEAKGALCGVWCLAALVLHLYSRPILCPAHTAELSAGEADSPNRARRLHTWATVAFVLALLSKPSAATLPLALLAFDRVCLSTNWRASLSETADWLIMGAVWIGLTIYLQPGSAMQFRTPLWARPFIAGDTLAFYITKLLVPWPLTSEYGRQPAIVLQNGTAYWTWIVPAALAVVWWYFQRSRVATAAIVTWLVLLLPVSGLVPFFYQDISTVADRYAYLPMIGMAVLFGLAAYHALAYRALVAAICLLLATWAGMSFVQAGTWHDSRTLLEYGLSINPNSHALHNNLAVIETVSGNYEVAREHLAAAIELRPAAAQPHITLGDIAFHEGDLATARTEYQLAIDRDKDSDRAYWSMAILLITTDDDREAAKLLRRCISINDLDSASYALLARLLAVSRDDKVRSGHEAIELVTKAIELTRGADPRFYDTLAAAQAEAGQFDEAAATAEAVATATFNAGMQEFSSMVRGHAEQFQRRQPLREKPQVPIPLSQSHPISAEVRD